jgi:hypothetical protein
MEGRAFSRQDVEAGSAPRELGMAQPAEEVEKHVFLEALARA